MGPLRNTVVGSLRYKAKCAFAANHEALDDLNGIIQGKVHQGIQAVSCCALDGELAADEGRKLLVCLHPACQVQNTRHQLLMCLQHIRQYIGELCVCTVLQ